MYFGVISINFCTMRSKQTAMQHVEVSTSSFVAGSILSNIAVLRFGKLQDDAPKFEAF